MVDFLQRKIFNPNFAETSNGIQEYHPTREVPTNLANNLFPVQNIHNHPETHTQPSLHNRLTTVLSLQTYISSALKIKKIWQSFIDLVKNSQSLQGIGQFFTKKFKGINISAIQLNNSFSFFKRKEIHHHTEIINYNSASEEAVQEMFKAFEEKNNDLKDQLLAQSQARIEFLIQKDEAQTQVIKELNQKNEKLARENKELTQKLETLSRETPSSEACLTLNTTPQPS